MTLIVLATICFLACVFLVLVQWMRDGKRKTTARPTADSEVSETRETKHPHIVGTRRIVERLDRFRVRSHGVTAATERPGGRESWYDERERMAYERIARSFKPGKRSQERRMHIFKWKKLLSLVLVGVFCGGAFGVCAFADDGKDQPPAKPATTASNGTSSGPSLGAAETACGGGTSSVWFPDLRKNESFIDLLILVKF